MTTDQMIEMVFGCCGAVVWLPTEFITEKRKTGDTFYCPNGHSRHYRETTAQRLEKELAAAKDELADKTRKLTDLKGGKCPFCWRTVKSLSSHIKNKHQ